MKYPKIVGWSVVIGMWSITICTLNHMKDNKKENLQTHSEFFIEYVEKDNTEAIYIAESMIEWVIDDVANGRLDSSEAGPYIDNLEQIIKIIK